MSEIEIKEETQRNLKGFLKERKGYIQNDQKLIWEFYYTSFLISEYCLIFEILANKKCCFEYYKIKTYIIFKNLVFILIFNDKTNLPD